MKPLIHYGGFASACVSRFESQAHKDLEARIQHRHGHAAEDECRPGCIYVDGPFPEQAPFEEVPDGDPASFSGPDA
ncbi:MAG: hypothetical protein HY556_07415 [Euryarchaeota archaeon]|nr:hypothetical protein [Euryarchaeota archaeon]